MSRPDRLSSLLIALALCAPVGAWADEADEALKLARQWQQAGSTVIRSPEGRILFSYGQSQPTVVCATFSLCVLRLEPGEIVESVNIGDAARWDISQARAGAGESLEEHIVMKPLAADIRTTLFVGTDRRSYLIELVGTADRNMGQVGFIYGDSRAGRAFGSGGGFRNGSDIELLPPPPAPVEPTVVPVVATPAGDAVVGDNLNFDYRVSGARVPWRPVRVFDDGRQTFIDFDGERISGRELPVFLVNDTDARGGMVNYRYDTRGRMIVDSLFARATLMLGKGRKAEKVFLTRDEGRLAARSNGVLR